MQFKYILAAGVAFVASVQALAIPEAAPEAAPEAVPAILDERADTTAAAAAAANLPGLNKVQSARARTIISRVKANKMPKRACLVAIATAMQESSIRILANSNVKASLKYAHDGVGHDHDSTGIFQQRGNGAWGTLAQRMSASKSTDMFLGALKKVKGWEKLSVAAAAQKVQRSCCPSAYAKWNKLATNVCNKGW